MKIVVTALAIASLAMPAYAQGTGTGKLHTPRHKAAQQPKKKKVDDSAYNAALKRIPDQPKADPWAGAR